jgi:hypothetical protein
MQEDRSFVGFSGGNEQARDPVRSAEEHPVHHGEASDDLTEREEGVLLLQVYRTLLHQERKDVRFG